MSTYNHTAVVDGAVNAAATVNTPLGTLDAAIGDLTALTTTAKTSALAAINEVDANADAAAATGATNTTSIGTLASLTTTAKTSAVAAINEVDANADAAAASVGGVLGGASATAQTLKGWTEAGAYELTAVTVDSDNVPTTATAKWPDGSAGTFTTTTKNSTWLAVDAYTVSHTASGQTVTQTAVTRNSNGTVTTKPALTVA